MERYIYSQGDLLNSPNTYFYTQYEGITFFKKWIESRSPALQFKYESLKAGKYFNKTKHENKIDIVKFTVQERINSSELLDCILYEIDEKKENLDLAYNYIDKFVKRFEIFKRVHDEYTPEFKAFDRKQYHNHALYIKAATIFEKAYQDTKKLPYINVLLKIIDTLLSFFGSLAESQKAELAELIIKEQHHINILAKNNGVSYDESDM